MNHLYRSSSGSISATPSIRLASSKEDQAWFDAQLDSFHDLGATTPIGNFLRQIVEIDSKPVALLAWGQACYALKDRVAGSVGALPNGSLASNSSSRTAGW